MLQTREAAARRVVSQENLAERSVAVIEFVTQGCHSSSIQSDVWAWNYEEIMEIHRDVPSRMADPSQSSQNLIQCDDFAAQRRFFFSERVSAEPGTLKRVKGFGVYFFRGKSFKSIFYS